MFNGDQIKRVQICQMLRLLAFFVSVQVSAQNMDCKNAIYSIPQFDNRNYAVSSLILLNPRLSLEKIIHR